MTRNEGLKKPLDVMSFIPWKGIALGPAFFLQVGNDVLPGDRPRLFAKQLHRLSYPRSAMYFFIRIAEQPDRFLAVSFKR